MPKIKHIYIAEAVGAEMRSLAEAELITGTGIMGDHHARDGAAPETQITLIEYEHIVEFEKATGLEFGTDAPRRNLVTTGIALNDLCGQQFRVGIALLEGIELCEPCATLMKRTYPEVLKFFVHKGGLRAKIVQGGLIQVGDEISAPAAVIT